MGRSIFHITSASSLFTSESGVPKKYQSLNKNYVNYVRQKYLNDNSEIFSQLKSEDADVRESG